MMHIYIYILSVEMEVVQRTGGKVGKVCKFESILALIGEIYQNIKTVLS